MAGRYQWQPKNLKLPKKALEDAWQQKKEVWGRKQWVKTAKDVFKPFALKHGGVRVGRWRSETTVVCNEKANCKQKAKGKLDRWRQQYQRQFE